LLKSFNNKYNILICGEGNLNCLFDNNNNKSQFVAVLHSYNLVCIFKFPTKIDPISQTVFGNVFIDTSTIAKYYIYPLINGLSDHDNQLLITNKVQKQEKECHTYIKRKMNKYTAVDFQLKLSHEI
jgi:hypothetical protein